VQLYCRWSCVFLSMFTLHVSAYMAILRCVWYFPFYSWRNLIHCFCCLCCMLLYYAVSNLWGGLNIIHTWRWPCRPKHVVGHMAKCRLFGMKMNWIELSVNIDKKRKTIYNKAARRRQLNLKSYWTIQCSRMLKYNIRNSKTYTSSALIKEQSGHSY
jgi:hypothetical protein